MPLDEAVAAARMAEVIQEKPTVTWPSDLEFEGVIMIGETGRRKIVGYAVREYELGLKREAPS